MVDTSRLKAIAKSQIKKNGSLAVILAGLTTLLNVISESKLQFIGSSSILSWPIDIIIAILGIFSSMVYINMARNYSGESTTWKWIKIPLGKLLKCFIFSIVLWILILITITGVGFISLMSPYFSFIIIILTIAFAICVEIYTTFSIFLILDRNCGVFESINLSYILVKGDFGNIFWLSISFIGWLFLSVITLGIASLFVIPYIGVTFANCYFELAATKLPPTTIEKELY